MAALYNQAQPTRAFHERAFQTPVQCLQEHVRARDVTFNSKLGGDCLQLEVQNTYTGGTGKKQCRVNYHHVRRCFLLLEKQSVSQLCELRNPAQYFLVERVKVALRRERKNGFFTPLPKLVEDT